MKKILTITRKLSEDMIYEVKWFLFYWWNYTEIKEKLLQIACVISTVFMIFSIHSCNQAFASCENTLAETQYNLSVLEQEIKQFQAMM